jgi:CxxC-x17-CxxC domain-containing protein
VYNDKNLTCADCGQEFVFTASEQDFYAQRGFTEPRRCPSCRASRKAARNANGGGGSSSSYGSYGAGGGYSAGGSSYGSGGGGGGGGGYSGGGGGYRDRGPREMFSATCSSCGKEAQVPFRPTSGKPVYCSDCFRSQRGGSAY